MSYSKKIMKQIKKIQRNEIIGHEIYAMFANMAKDHKTKEILAKVAESELSHYNSLKEFSGMEAKPNRIKKAFTKHLVFIASKLLGYTFILKFFEINEANATDLDMLIKEAPEVAKFIKDEERHEQMLIEAIDEERLKYMGSIVLGLNDALVELTGALAGFTFSIQNTKTIALMGLITGISASFSMAASEYLSTRAEDNDDGTDAKKASLFTGLAYVFTVIFLILPFFLISNYMTALLVTVVVAVGIIAFFNYYISVAKGDNFKRRFAEMAIISIGVAGISFLIGYLVKTFIGIEI